MSDPKVTHARSRARRLAVQALYQWLVSGDEVRVVIGQFLDDRNTGRADRDYFRAIVAGVADDEPELESMLAPLLDRPVAQLDPVEHVILLLAMLELRDRSDVPFRVIIDEAVELARMFGADQSWRFINAVVDRASRALRGDECSPNPN